MTAITAREQVFNAENLVGTPKHEIVKKLVPGGHVGLFMGSHTLERAGPKSVRGSGTTNPCRDESTRTIVSGSAYAIQNRLGTINT